MKYDTIKDACRAWVSDFNAIPQSVIEKLYNYDGSVVEITPPSMYDNVSVDDNGTWKDGEIIKTNGDTNEYLVKLEEDPSSPKVFDKRDVYVTHYYEFPMWGTMWTFGEKIDEDWLTGKYCESHLQDMADCGFRIYQSEDFGIIFGIDGAGYDFYEHHWIPLYNARGLKWHKETKTA